jgi:hypothetical protein
MLPRVESYKQDGSSFHLNQDEAQAARQGIDAFYSHVTHCTHVDGQGNTVYTARNAADFDQKLTSLNLKKE